MIPKNHTLESFTEGCAFEGIPSLSITVNGITPASALASAEMSFTKLDVPESAKVKLTSNPAAGITIESAPNWSLSIPRQAVPGLTAGRWQWTLYLTAADTLCDPYLTGTLAVNSRA